MAGSAKAVRQRVRQGCERLFSSAKNSEQMHSGGKDARMSSLRHHRKLQDEKHVPEASPKRSRSPVNKAHPYTFRVLSGQDSGLQDS